MAQVRYVSGGEKGDPYLWTIFYTTCPVCDVRRPSTELWIQVSKPNIFPTLSLHRLPLEQPQNRLLTQTHHIKQQVCHIVELLNNQVSNQKILPFFKRQYISQIKEIMLFHRWCWNIFICWFFSHFYHRIYFLHNKLFLQYTFCNHSFSQ